MNQATQRLAAVATDRGGLRQWIAAGSMAVALHAGAAAMLLSGGSTADSVENFGTMAMEVGIEDTAPSFDSTEAPADSDLAFAAAAAPSETAAVQPEPTPAASSDTPEPDQPTTAAPREQAEQPENAVEVAASAAVVPSSAAAPSRAAEQESERSVAAAIGSSAEARRAQATWRRRLVAHIERQKRYPASGAQRSADIVVSFTIDRQGRLTAVQIAKGSGDARFDQAALEMLRRADPLPAPPSAVADGNLSFRVPISFRPGG